MPLRDVRAERLFAAAVFLVYLAVTLWVTLHHEVWSDESDPWLLMRDGGIRLLFEQTAAGHRGTPALWFLSIWPLAAAGAPVIAQQLLNLAFAAAAVLLFVRSAPFPGWVRALFAFSYIPAFEYAVIARPYAAMMLLLFVVAAVWKKRATNPLLLAVVVALLANTTVHGLLFGGLIGLLLLEEAVRDRSPRQFTAVGVMFAGGLASVAQLWPRAGGQVSLYRVELDTVWYALSNAIFPDARTSTAIVPALLVLLLASAAIGRRAAAQFFLWGSLLPLFAIFVFVWVGGFRHTGIVLLVLLVALWMAGVDGRSRLERLAMVALGIALAYSVVFAGRTWIVETKHAFSGSRSAAEYISANLGSTPVAAHRPMACSPVLAYLPGKRFWYPARGEWGSYMKWDRGFQLEQEMPAELAIERARRRFAGRKWALLLSAPLPADVAADYRLLYRTAAGVWAKSGESYWLYEPVDIGAGPDS